jgi:protein ImuB
MFASVYASGNLAILLECAQRFSPLIEITSSDQVTFDIRGLSRTFGFPDQIANEIERTIGIPAHVAVASNPDTAIYAARANSGVTVIPSGKEAERLARLSLHLLGCPADIGDVLDVWGIRTFGQFAQLPALGVAARLGAEGTYWQQQTQGAVQRQLRLMNEPVRFSKELDLEHAVTNLEPLLFLVGRFLFELCLELKAQFLATNEVRLTLRLDGPPDHIVHLLLPVPMANQKALLKLVRLEFDQHPPPAPVVRVQLELTPVTPKTQKGLFTPAYPIPEQIEVTLARVRRTVGPENFGTPELLNSHQPDGFLMRPFVASAKTTVALPEKPISLDFRRFRPPEPAQVDVEQVPIAMSCRVVKGKIRSARGPWFTSGHWWTHDVWDREEWDVALQDDTLYRIFHDLRTKTWFVEANYVR